MAAESIVGTWHGKPAFDGRAKGEPSPTYIFRFEISKQGEFTGVMEFPNQGIPEVPITEMKIIDDDFTFKTQDMKFEMKLGDSEIAGSFKYLRVAGPNGSFRNVRSAQPDIPLTLKKGEYAAPVYMLNLPTEIIDQLLGEWYGPLWFVVFRFKMTKNGEFVGYYNIPLMMLPGTGMPVIDASMSDGKLTLKAENGDEYKGTFSDKGILGQLTREGETEMLDLIKRE